MHGFLAGSGVPRILVSLLALGAVLALILLLAWLGRKLPLLMPTQPEPNGLRLRGALRLDGRRRLLLVEAGGQLTLVLTGGATDVVIHLPQSG